MTDSHPQDPHPGDQHHADPHGHAPTNLDDHHDPLHDIDGPKTIFAVFGTLGFIVFLIWAMSHLFNVMVRVERQEKIGNVKPLELEKIRAVETEELTGKNSNRGAMTIEQAIDAYLK